MVDWENHDEAPTHVTSANVSDADVEAYHRHRKRMKRQQELEKRRQAEAQATENPRGKQLEQLLSNLNTAVSTLSMFAADGLINDWVSGEEAMHARHCAAVGDLKGLKKIKVERALWAREGKNYLTMISWDIPDAAGHTAIFLAVKHNHSECVRFLLFEGANPNIANDAKDTCLHVAPSLEVAELLLAHGANPAAIDQYERTPYELHRGKRYDDMSAGISTKHIDASTTHLAFKKEHQVRAKRTKSRGQRLNAEEHAKAQELANEALLDHQRELDRKAHDELVARAQEHCDKARGLMALLNHEAAVPELHECLAIFPDHEDALRLLRELASSKGPSASRPAARQALLSLINPSGDGSDSAPKLDVRQKSRSSHGSDLMASDLELIVEAKSMFRAMDTSNRRYLTVSQLTSRAGDFGLEAEEVQHLSMLMDADANDKIPFEYFLAGFSRFKAMAGGHGAISLSAETEMKLHHIAHVAENHVIDQRFEQMQAMKVEAHSIVMSEAPTLAYEPDTLSIRGLPFHFFAECKNDLVRNEKVAELVHPFGFVMASSTTIKDAVFGNACSGLAKFAMTCSVEEAIETGLTVKDINGEDVQLELAIAQPNDFFERVELRHLDLIARGRQAEAAEFKAQYEQQQNSKEGAQNAAAE